MPSSSSTRRGRAGPRRLLAAAAAAAGACLATRGGGAFAGGVAPRALRRRVAVSAESDGSSSSSSVALVKVTEENKMTTASVVGGVAGLLVGGVWVGGALFAATSYLSRKEDDDVSKALKGIASGSLEVLNFGAYLNDKYAVTDRLGTALTDALESTKTATSSASTATTTAAASQESASPAQFLSTISKTIEEADKEIGFKETLGTLATSASELAFQAVDKAVELNDKYKVTEQIKDKIQESASSVGKSTSTSARSS